MQEYAVIRNNSKEMFFKDIDDPNIYSCFKVNYTFPVKVFVKFHLLGHHFFYGNWKKRIRQYKTVILFDTGTRPEVIQYIRKKNKECKIIFYYWNFINPANEKYLHDKNIDEIWSFDLTDCQKYHLKYNPQLYSKNVPVIKKNEKYQVSFLGRDKGRKEQVLKLKKKLEELAISTDFQIIEKETDIVEYEDYLKMIENSNTLLDIIDNTHTGLTLRVMEALFFEKKLITNNLDIQNCDFYHPSNVFILGKDDLENLKTFIESDYHKISSTIVNQYDYESWLKRFQ